MWKDFKWVEKRFGTKFANILKGFDKGSKEIEEHFTTKENHEVTFTDANGVQNTLVTEQGISEVLAKNGLIEVKWQELKDKRDNGQLIPGSLYRITDYNCTTTQENTQSAGHQFDIVLLALSENKLAEEGWAMMHDNDVYSIHCSDGVDIKVYINIIVLGEEDAEINLVLTDNHLGTVMNVPRESIPSIIDESTKSINIPIEATSTELLEEFKEENLTYNYFQNSNLSAWKVWYSLDNDKSRFAWADDTYKLNPASIICDCYNYGVGTKVDGPIDCFGKQFVNGTIYYRDEEKDTTIPFMGNAPAYAWTSENDITIFTTSVSPNSLSKIYSYATTGRLSMVNGDSNILYLTTSYVEGLPNYDFPNGRGVIYRLIDEFNNDVAYDFKNIQYARKLTDGEYDVNGTNTWCYTFNGYDLQTQELMDATLHHGKLLYEDDYIKNNVANNTILSYTENMLYSSYYCLPNICILDVRDADNDHALRTYCNHINSCCNLTIQGNTNGVTFIETSNTNVQLNDTIYLILCSGGGASLITYDAGIYIRNKKVLTET